MVSMKLRKTKNTDDNSDDTYFSAEENLSFSEEEYFSFTEEEYFS